MSAPFGGAADPDAAVVHARPDSVPVGVVEHRIWQPLGGLALQLGPAWGRDRAPTKDDGWAFKYAVIAAAEQLDYDTKMPGDRRGKIGASGIKVLKALFGIVNLMSGRLEPSIATIAAKAKLARATVVEALKRLKKEGFLWWIRRKEELDNEGPGPQIHQATNAYWFKLRGRAAGLVRNWLMKRRPPVPDDAADRLAADREATEAMLARAPAVEVARFRLGGSPLGEALASLGRTIDGSANSIKGRNPKPRNKDSADDRR